MKLGLGCILMSVKKNEKQTWRTDDGAQIIKLKDNCYNINLIKGNGLSIAILHKMLP